MAYATQVFLAYLLLVLSCFAVGWVVNKALFWVLRTIGRAFVSVKRAHEDLHHSFRVKR